MSESPIQDSLRAVELERLSQVCEVDGLTVEVRCFFVAKERPHYELLVSCQGEAGIIDVAMDGDLDEHMKEAAICFATSLRLRQAFPS